MENDGASGIAAVAAVVWAVEAGMLPQGIVRLTDWAESAER
jgi:hypothetical protein